MQAIILAAGMGKRLRKLTEKNPKCMVEVNGVSLIKRMLFQLDKLELNRIVVVVGYKKQILIDYIKSLGISTPFLFISNDIYDKTNNIYSLSLAKDYLLNDDTLLLESDLVFENSVLQCLIDDERDSLALVDKYESWMDGTCVKLREDDTIETFIPGRNFVFDEIPNYYKTVNIYKFSRAFSTKYYVPFLNAYSMALGNNEYYEEVLRIISMLDEPVIKGKRLNGQHWYEIDDVQDLDIAESIFSDTCGKYEHISNRFGGYWRYPKMIDFVAADNPYYPPKRLIDEIKANAERLISEYPSGQAVNALLVAKNLQIESTDYVAVSNGIEEIAVALFGLLNERVGVLLPTNAEYVRRINKNNVEFFISDDRGLTYNASSIIQFCEYNCLKCFIITNPNVQTGFYLKNNQMDKLLEYTKERNVRLIIDESYMDYCSEKLNKTINEVVKSYPNVIILKNLSASHGVSGLRIGCAVSADVLLIKKLRDELTIWNVNSFAEFYLQIAEKYTSDYRNSLEELRKTREEFVKELESISGLNPLPSETDYVTCELVNPISVKELAGVLLDKYRIHIKDNSLRINNGKKYIRVAVKTESENKYLLDSLRRVLEA